MEITVGPYRMAVGADDVALRDLGQQHLARFQERLSSRDRERLLGWVTVVEIHDPRLECVATVAAGPSTGVTKKSQRCLLATSNALEFILAMRSVVLGVVSALVVCGPHLRQLEQAFTSRE